MCGFAGFIGPIDSRDALERTAMAMSGALCHRGPDSAGAWADADLGIVLGHRRLAVIDTSPGGHQPMVSASGRFVIAFNGEIYNFTELRRNLERVGKAPEWRGSSDTEVLLASIEANGLREALDAAVGMFAFAVWDRSERRLLLARDRLGEKPLYFGWRGETFLFGSELSALKRHPAWHSEIDRDALALLLRLGYIPAPSSIYRGIAKLAPGTLLELRAGAKEHLIETYWSAADAASMAAQDPYRCDAEVALNEVERRLTQAVSEQMIADVPLGAFLSGGIDSSLVTATMQGLSRRPVKTFTIGFEDVTYDEAKTAGAIARHLGTDHTELYVTARNALDIVPQLPVIYSEPFADASQIPTYLISRLARQSVTVALSGDGGDEVFSGYDRYRVAERFWPQIERFPPALRRSAAGALQTVPAAAWGTLVGSRLGERASKFANVLASKDLDEAYHMMTSHWQQSESVVLGASSASARLADLGDAGDAVRRMMLADLVGYLPGDILTKVDRAAMSVSLETRMPFLDHRLVEFSFHLPTSILRHERQSKWITKELLARRVPRSLFSRPKMGFSVPLADWLRGPLKDWAEALLAPERLKREGYFEAAPIRAAWSRHLSGAGNSAHALWAVLMFQAWLERERGSQP